MAISQTSIAHGMHSIENRQAIDVFCELCTKAKAMASKDKHVKNDLTRFRVKLLQKSNQAFSDAIDREVQRHHYLTSELFQDLREIDGKKIDDDSKLDLRSVPYMNILRESGCVKTNKEILKLIKR